MARITWFPGHMRQAMGALKRVIKGVDLVLEVRDARVPFSSSNPELSAIFKQKRHILVLNKADLVPNKLHKATIDHLQQGRLKVMSASCTSTAGVRQVMHTALDWLQRERAASDLSIMMVVGLPNSGKSSLINAFKVAAKKQGVLTGEQAFNKRAKVGSTPGLTRQVAGFQVSAEPCVYMLDTPGIMVPAVPSDEVGFRLALAGAIKDSVVGEEDIVRYMLRFLARTPYSLRTIRASGPMGSGKARRGGSGSSGPKFDAEVVRMRTCLHKAILGPQLPLLGPGEKDALLGCEEEEWDPAEGDDIAAVEGRLLRMQHNLASADRASSSGTAQMYSGLPPWVEAASVADAELQASLQRFDQLIECLWLAAERNASKQQGALIRLLRAFREGHFGKYMLDAVGLPGPSG